ncbi:MAG: cohesin domain-containing protein [bacterium]|nr:cohesin domain-containing protein [bacterium]
MKGRSGLSTALRLGLKPETEYSFRIIGGEAAEFNFVTSSEGLAVRIDPCLKQAQAGETFTLDVWVENVTHLSEAGLRFHFNSAVLNGLGITPGDFLGDNILPILNTYDVQKGIMGIGVAIKRDKPDGERKEVNGSGIVARLSFSARAAGATEIIIDRDRKVLALRKQDGRSSVDGFNHLFLGSAQVIVNP